MTTMIVEEMAQIPMSPYLVATLKRAAEYAEAQSHLKVTLEHTLLALTEDPEASIVLKSSSIEMERLQSDVSNFLGNIQERQNPQNVRPIVTDGELKRILEAAAAAAQQGQRREMNGAILLAAIIGDGRSDAAHILSSQGLTFEEVIDALKSQMRAPSALPEKQQPDVPPENDSALLLQTAPADQPRAAAPPQKVESHVSATSPSPSAMSGPPVTANNTHTVVSGAAAAAASTDEILASARQRVGSQRAGTQAFEDGSAARALTPDWQPIAATVPPPGEIEKSNAPPRRDVATGAAPDGRASQGQLRSTPPLSHRVPPPVSPNAGLTPPPPPAPNATSHGSFAPSSASPIAAPPQLQRGGSMMPPGSAPPWSGPGAQAPQTPKAPQPPARPATPPDGRRAQPPPAAGPRSTRIDIETGALEDSIPTRMRAGVSKLVEVRLARTGVKALAEGLEFSGAIHRRDSHLITKALSVKLRAPDGGFWVEAASPETQWIENVLGVMTDDYVSWRWLVTPKAKGASRLQLVVSARTVGTDGLAAETAVPDRIFNVRVARNYRQLAARVGGWLVAAGLGAAVVWFASPMAAFLKKTLDTFLTSASW